MTPAQIVSRFCLGESIDDLAADVEAESNTAEQLRALPPESREMMRAETRHMLETALRHDMQWLYETEGLATQAPANLATALMQQSADHCTAIDTSDWARGYRAGYATGKQESADAVGHLGNVLLARAHGVTREGNT